MSVFRLSGVSAIALAAFSGAAYAGGFAISEQSTVFMGSASAGVAAGGSLGSMYWNPAATASLPGTNTESSYTLVIPRADVDATSNFGVPGVGFFSRSGNSGNIGIDAVTGASYGSYQVSKDLWIGMGINSPFGLATKPDNTTYPGSILGVTTKLLTIDANPTVAYKIAPGITIGVGAQILWAQGKVQFNENPFGGSTAQFGGTDWAYGATAGITIEPARGTTIGVGWRSGMDLDLGGTFHQPNFPLVPIPTGVYGATGSLKLPDLVSASFRQEISPVTRLLGTVEWTNWSRFQSLDLVANGVGTVSIPANWSDGWFFSLGGEYDYTPSLTLRSGVAYELSPEDDAAKRLTAIPDNNRIWLNLGASYKWSESLTFDVAYAHIFVQDGGFSSSSPITNIPVSGNITNASVDLFSVGMRSVW